MNRQLRYIILGISFITLLITGYQMWRLPLWGWWTFFFLIAFWASIVGLRLKKYNLRWLALSSLSGIILSLGFPVSPLTPLMFVGFVPLLLLEKELRASDDTKEGILKYAYNAFVIWNIGSTWWVANSALLPGMIANFLNALFMAFPFWLFHKSWKYPIFNNYLKYATFPLFWMAFEYVHLNWEISWPWLTLGNAFAQYPSWIQWYEYTGVFGGSLWILLINLAVFTIIDNKFFSGKIITQPLIATVLGLVIPLSISMLMGGKTTTTDTPRASVVVVQPNFEPHYQKFNIPDEQQFKKFISLALQKVDSTTDYLVFPETSFDLRNIDKWSMNPLLLEWKYFVNQYPKLHLVMGVDALKIYAQFSFEKPANMPKSVREFDNKDGTFTYFEVYNAATQVASGASTFPLYKKSKLVPGPEILPYGFLFVWLKPLFKKFGGTLGGLGEQPERSVFWNNNGKTAVAPVICYESIYGDYAGGYVRAGANALFVVTNDGWWDDTPGYKQHLAFARLRAIELRRSVVRSANTGSSCFIDSYGNVSQATPYATDAVIKGDIELNSGLTFYAKYGDIIGKIAAWMSLLLVLMLLFFRIKKR